MTAPDAAPLDRLLEHRAWVRGLVRTIVLDASRADDVEQDVWLAAVRRRGEPVDEPRAWLTTVARNFARRAYRGAARRTRREAAAARPEALATDGDAVERAETHRAIVDAVLALPEPLRIAVLLHYFDGLPVAEVAARLAVPRETVRSRLRLARGRLRTALGPAESGAACSPALLAIAGLPRDLGAAAHATGGMIAVTTAQKVAFALVVPAAVGAAWVTSSAVSGPPEPPALDGPMTELAARLDRVERDLAARNAARPTEDRGLERRVVALEARLAEATAALDPARPASSATAPASSPGAESGKIGVPKSAAGPATSAHDAISDGLSAQPGSKEHLDALRRLADWLARHAGPPPVANEISWAEGLLEAEARRGRIDAAEAADLLPRLDATAQGNAARPGLASAVAGGWAKDPRLGPVLDRFAANTEPAVHRRLLPLLDHVPSAAFGDYVLRLVRDERDASVLSSVLDPDRILAATTLDTAMRLAHAIEARLGDGALTGKLRTRAAAAIAVAGLRAPQAGAELLGRVADRETDASLAERCRSAAASLAAGNATADALEDAFR